MPKATRQMFSHEVCWIFCTILYPVVPTILEKTTMKTSGLLYKKALLLGAVQSIAYRRDAEQCPNGTITGDHGGKYNASQGSHDFRS